MSKVPQSLLDRNERKRVMRVNHGVNCPGCLLKHPKRNPTLLMPGQKCKWCGHLDPRERLA